MGLLTWQPSRIICVPSLSKGKQHATCTTLRVIQYLMEKLLLVDLEEALAAIEQATTASLVSDAAAHQPSVSSAHLTYRKIIDSRRTQTR